MKKTLCILLSVLMVFTSFVFCVHAQDAEMKVFVTSDTHWHDYGSVNSDGFYRPRADMGQLTALSPLICDRFLKDAAASDADFVFISGDLTDYGSDDALAFADILADFEDATGKQVFVVPGNHDIHMSSDPDDHLRFRRIYSRFGWDGALAVDEATSSYVADLKNGYRLLGINSNKDNGGGVITDGLFAWIEAQVKQAQADGVKLIAMMHHHIMEHLLLEQRIDDFYIIDNYKEVCKKFAEWNIRVTFTGHLHWGDIAEYQGKNKIYDVTTFSLPEYPLRYREVSFTGSEIRLESHTIDSLDVTNIVSGYSEEQKEMIANDPVKYARGAETDSLVSDYIGKFVDPDYLIDLLGFAPDSVGAKAIRRIMPDVLVPLYGEGETAEAMAKKLGYELPPSDYETVGELLSAFWAAMARGDENLGGNSPEGKLVLDAAYALFATKAAQESPAVRALLNARVIAFLGLKGIDNIFTRKAFDLILVGLTVDRTPADNDATLPGYEADTSGVLFRLTEFFGKIAVFFRLLFAFGAVS